MLPCTLPYQQTAACTPLPSPAALGAPAQSPPCPRWAAAQAGTPTVRISSSYDASARTLALKVSQKNQHAGTPQLIPLSLGLLGADGKPLPLHLKVSFEQCGTHEWHIPLSLGLLGADGKPLPLHLKVSFKQCGTHERQHASAGGSLPLLPGIAKHCSSDLCTCAEQSGVPACSWCRSWVSSHPKFRPWRSLSCAVCGTAVRWCA